MAATSPYKSKLFTFLNRQSIQWGSRLTEAARRLKITLEWGTQIALYPLYLLVQTSRVATRQFTASQGQRQTLAAQASATAADLTTEIMVLTAPEAQTRDLQGIACDLNDRDIIFIDRQNQAVEPHQTQAFLQQQISLHLSALDHPTSPQAQVTTAQMNPRFLPSIQTQRPDVLPPVRWLLQGLHWLEQSPVAIAIDLFGESRWHSTMMPPEIYTPQLLPPLPLAAILQPLDQRIAQLEQQLLQPQSATDAPPLQRFLQVRWQRFADTPTPNSDAPPAASPSPWLTWADLFQAKLVQTQVNPRTDSPILTSAPTPKPQWSPPILAERLQNLNQPNALTSPTVTPTELAIAAPVNNELTATTREDSPSGIEAQPEWIETQALSVGYEQHFLERLLKALDHLLLWLENTVAQLWSKLHR